MKPRSKVTWVGPVKKIVTVQPKRRSFLRARVSITTQSRGVKITYRMNRLRPVALNKIDIMRVYERVVKAWQRARIKLDGFQCQFVYANGRRCQHRAHRRPHHMAGRGPNLARPETFMATCLRHHDWIHAHAREARKRGFLLT